MWENFVKCITVKMTECSYWLDDDWALTNHGQQLPLSTAAWPANLSPAHPSGHSHFLNQKTPPQYWVFSCLLLPNIPLSLCVHREKPASTSSHSSEEFSITFPPFHSLHHTAVGIQLSFPEIILSKVNNK